MFEKVNPKHPDKVMDVIAGAIVDLAYKKNDNPKIAVEGLIGHGIATIIVETSEDISEKEIVDIVRKHGNYEVKAVITKQDNILSENQINEIRCGDNGIFKGVPTNKEEKQLVAIAKKIYSEYKFDGKYILNGNELVVCQSNAEENEIKELLKNTSYQLKINPLGYWVGGTDVDTGAVNRKLGSDMGRAVSGGGLHGKDLSKADVSVNIYAFLKAQETGEEVELCCAIGDDEVDGKPYGEIVEIARNYIKSIGGFEEFAKWGLING